MKDDIKIIVILITFIVALIAGAIYFTDDQELDSDYSPYIDKPSDGIENHGDISSVCTRLEYSRWSHCAEDGTQSRAVTAVHPDGCMFTQDTLVKQFRQCTYVPITSSVTELINKMVRQISSAPNQTITTQYLAGATGDIIAANKWKLSLDNTTLFLELLSKNRLTGVKIEYLILGDETRDFIPDIYSNNGDDWYALDNRNPSLVQNYTTIWAIAAAHFGSYLLDD